MTGESKELALAMASALEDDKRLSLAQALEEEDAYLRFRGVAANLAFAVRLVLGAIHDDDVLPVAELVAPLLGGMPERFAAEPRLYMLTNATLEKLAQRTDPESYPGEFVRQEQDRRRQSVV